MPATVHNVQRMNGPADTVAYQATVTHSEEGDEITHYRTFSGFTYGTPGTVMLLCEPVAQRVARPERFGDRFNEEWVRRFYADPPSSP